MEGPADLDTTQYFKMETDCLQEPALSVEHTESAQEEGSNNSVSPAQSHKVKLPPSFPTSILRSSASGHRKLRRGRCRETISLVEEYIGNSKEMDPRVPLYQLLISHKLPGKDKSEVRQHTVL